MPGGKSVFYNGIPTIKQKTTLAKEKASGIMIWQLGGDARGSKSLLNAIYKTAYKNK
jgi:GH18 family chitinase